MRYQRTAVARSDVALTSHFHFPGRGSRQAFTRVEMLASLAAAALLGALLVPALATGPSRSQNAQCLNNLRLIGRAVQMWAMEHNGLVSWRVSISDGGSYFPFRPGEAWFEYQVVSNQLVTPRVLACPADTDTVVASDFTSAPPGGYLQPSFRSQATSYSLNVHSLADQPRAVLCGDRNIRFTSSNVNCPIAGVANAETLNVYDPNAGWTNAVHGPSGNVVLMDGSVLETSTSQLLTLVRESSTNGFTHFLRAR